MPAPYIILMVCLAGLGLCGCRDDQPQVVLYVSADEHIAREVIAAFERRSGVRVLTVGDTEAKKTAGLAARLKSERNRPQADVFWSSEIFMTIELANEGVFEPHESPTTRDWPAEHKDAQNRWFGFAARARVIVYAPDRVPEDAVPRTWMALTNDRFRGRIVMADPRFGTTGGHVAAMKWYWTRRVMPGYFAAFLEGLAENHIRLLPSGNAGVVEAVARGEADVGMTDTDDVWAAQARNLNVQLVYPAHHVDVDAPGTGTLLIPNTVARVKGGPNPSHAAQLIDYLLSAEVERMLAESVSHNVPLRPGLAAEYSKFAVPNALKADLEKVAELRSAAIDETMRVLTHEQESVKADGSRK